METSRWSKKPASTSPAPPVTPQVKPAAVEPPPANEPETYAGDPSIDEFAQSRAEDDLFDDDFTPIAEPVVEQRQPVAEKSPPKVAELAPAAPHFNPRDAPKDAPRAPRGRGTPRKTSAAPPAQSSPPATGETDAANDDDAAQAKPERKESAVRGDRSKTGGVKKAKLTEEELAAKFQAMKLKNASLMEKHAKSQADEDSFNAREAVAAERRKEDRVNRVQMMGEREKNRQRKMKAVGGREWDMEKKEEDFTGDDGRRARRGVHGGIVGETPTASGADGKANSERGGFEIRGRGRGRGRGGDRGDRGRGRGGPANGGSERPQKPKESSQAPPSASDFPDLPAAAPKTTVDDNKAPAKLEFPIKPKDTKPRTALESLVSPMEKKSWADQVEGAAD